jgi:hypothetical protein
MSFSGARDVTITGGIFADVQGDAYNIQSMQIHKSETGT